MASTLTAKRRPYLGLLWVSFFAICTEITAFAPPVSQIISPPPAARSSSAISVLSAPSADGWASSIASSGAWVALDTSSEVSEGVRTAAFFFLGAVVIFSGISAYVTQFVVPGQMAKLIELVRRENPDRWAEIEAKLTDGEKLTDRPDLMSDLVDSGVVIMVKENEVEIGELLAKVRDSKESDLPIDSLREPLEKAFGASIEEYIAAVDRMSNSNYVTDTDREMAEILRIEFKGDPGN